MDPGDRGKRKVAEKDMSHHGRGRTAAVGSSRAAPHGRGAREAHDQYIEDEEHQELEGHTTDQVLDTPQHITEFDSSYIRDYVGDMTMTPPNNSRQHQVIDYSKSWKAIEEARADNPYAMWKDLGVDYRFCYCYLEGKEEQDSEDAVHRLG